MFHNRHQEECGVKCYLLTDTHGTVSNGNISMLNVDYSLPKKESNKKIIEWL